MRRLLTLVRALAAALYERVRGRRVDEQSGQPNHAGEGHDESQSATDAAPDHQASSPAQSETEERRPATSVDATHDSSTAEREAAEAGGTPRWVEPLPEQITDGVARHGAGASSACEITALTDTGAPTPSEAQTHPTPVDEPFPGAEPSREDASESSPRALRDDARTSEGLGALVAENAEPGGDPQADAAPVDQATDAERARVAERSHAHSEQAGSPAPGSSPASHGELPGSAASESPPAAGNELARQDERLTAVADDDDVIAFAHDAGATVGRGAATSQSQKRLVADAVDAPRESAELDGPDTAAQNGHQRAPTAARPALQVVVADASVAPVPASAPGLPGDSASAIGPCDALLHGSAGTCPVPPLAASELAARATLDEATADVGGSSDPLEGLQASESDFADRTTKPQSKRAPRQYRPLPRVPPVVRAARPPVAELAERAERALRIELRLRLEHGGFCRLSLLPRRDPTLPDVLTVTDGATTVSLVALQDDWYQDVAREDLGALLRRGIEWEGRDANGEAIRWSLSGRELFVLAQHDQLSGFVTTPRLVLGERHAVLCVREREDEVRARLEDCGCAALVSFDGSHGAPDGWVGFRDAVPKLPALPSTQGSILDALCPQPDVEIALTGGIRLQRSTWLEGFAPRIRLRGDAGAAGEVWIDGKLATAAPEDGAYAVEHCDAPGDHQVWCAGKSASYSIASGDEAWEPWDAYRWSFGEAGAVETSERPAICGVLTLPPRPNDREARQVSRRGLVIAASNPVLLGRAPGQVYGAPLRGDLRARTCTAFPPFDPVWALPGDALHCDKRSSRVLLIGPLREPEMATPNANVMAWCSAILAASRKGLLTEPGTAEVGALWKRYKLIARAYPRRFR